MSSHSSDMFQNEERCAIVLFNLGAPDTLNSVHPFLKNLFSDPAILTMPALFRWCLARLISFLRTPKAKKIYESIGGGSPLLPNTLYQAEALRALLKTQFPETIDFEIFVAMRYWHPLIADVTKKVEAFHPDRVILLPLYPQYSSTTTGSSLKEWQDSCSQRLKDIPTQLICCYPTQPQFIEAHQDLLLPLIDAARRHGKPRILFSAHGLPQKIIDAGDPYARQVALSTHSVVAGLPEDVEPVICYQSKVGPTKWLTPSLESEIRRAAQDQVPVIVCPISFVSEHSETLAELDQQYALLAQQLHIPYYGRVPALAIHPSFIQGLADLIKRQLSCSETALQDACPQKNGQKNCPWAPFCRNPSLQCPDINPKGF